MPGRQKLSLLPEDLADSLFVEARSIGYIGIGMIESLFLDVTVQTARHAVVIHHFWERRAECFVASSTGVTTTDQPEGDTLSVDRQVAVSDISLAKSDKLAHGTALLASDGGGWIYVEMQPILLFHSIQYLIFRKVQYVVEIMRHFEAKVPSKISDYNVTRLPFIRVWGSNADESLHPRA